jgi:hypothetical protein
MQIVQKCCIGAAPVVIMRYFRRWVMFGAWRAHPAGQLQPMCELVDATCQLTEANIVCWSTTWPNDLCRPKLSIQLTGTGSHPSLGHECDTSKLVL